MWMNDSSTQKELLKLYGNGVQGKECTGDIDGFSDSNREKIRGWMSTTMHAIYSFTYFAMSASVNVAALRTFVAPPAALPILN